MFPTLFAALITVTNLAGKVTSGEFVRATEHTLTLCGGLGQTARPSSGRERTIPLSVLIPESRAAVLALAGIKILSPREKAAARHREIELRRIDAKERAGFLTPEEAAAMRGRHKGSPAATDCPQ